MYYKLFNHITYSNN